MLRRAAALALIAVVTAWTFAPSLGFAFLNWDDDAVIVSNAALTAPGVVRWAFTTTYMEHYQPLSWLAWAAIARGAGVQPPAFHLANVLAHVVCAVLVFAALLALLRRAVAGMSVARHEAVAAAGALLYAVHPFRVEVVAWVSALPYALALALALLSLLAWLRTTSRAGTSWWIAPLLLYGASLLARPVVLGFPVVLVLIDVTLLARAAGAAVTRVAPLGLAALAAGVAEGFARAPAAGDLPWLFRLQSAALAPFVYLWRTIAPVRLTPLDLLPENPGADVLVAAAALLAIAGGAAVLWHWRKRRPAAVAAAIAYLVLLAPAAALVAGGLQYTADRYTYVPDVILAIAVATAGARWAGANTSRQRIAAASAILLIGGSVLATRQALNPWRDSITLWTRAAELDATNHVALYNLAVALGAAGRREEAAERYREVLALAPAHAQARTNLDRLDAARFEREGSEAAARGDLRAAAERFARAIAADAGRTHAQAGLGMALAAQGRSAEAVAPLRAALRQGSRDTAVPNTLAMLLIDAGQPREARAVLEDALEAHREDVGLAHNLARLLATEPAFAKADALALRLANAVVDATSARDPRAPRPWPPRRATATWPYRSPPGAAPIATPGSRSILRVF